MTSRRATLRALGSIAALQFFETLGVEELIAVGRRANALAESRRSDTRGFSPRALTPAQYEIVVQAAERIIPRTDTPGATDAGVADFIDVMLADWYGAAERDRFTTGLSELDARARAMHEAADVLTRRQSAHRALSERGTALQESDAHAIANILFVAAAGRELSEAQTEKVGTDMHDALVKAGASDPAAQRASEATAALALDVSQNEKRWYHR